MPRYLLRLDCFARLTTAMSIVLFLASGAVPTHGDWPRFRGPAGNGHAEAVDLPVKWNETENIRWKVTVPGQGHSSPVLVDGQIWLTTALTTELSEEEKKDRLKSAKNPKELNLVGSLSLRAMCFDAQSGKQLRDIELLAVAEPEPIHYTNTYASPTPLLYQGKLIAHFGTYGTVCVDCESGNVQWRNDELKVNHQNGPGSSPLVWDDLVIMHMDGIDHQFIAALNLSDGKLVWKTDRSGETHPVPEMKKAYCTPVVVETDRGPELISAAANWVYGYHPRTGSELWKAHYGDLGFSTVPAPVIGHDMAYVCTSFTKSQLLAVRYGGRGDVTQSHIVWKSDSQIPKKPSLLLVGERLFVCNDTGILTCLNALNGKEEWRARVGGNFSASPLLANGLVYIFNQEGKTTIFKANGPFEVVAENELAEGCHASPAVDGRALIIRTATQLYRIENQL